MELGWVTAIVTTLVGGFVTLATLWRTTAMAAKRDKDAADREDARRREDHARERRSLEWDAIGVSYEAYTGDAQTLVVRCSYLAFEILSAWLREEPMSAKHVSEAANFAKVLQSYYDSFNQPDQ